MSSVLNPVNPSLVSPPLQRFNARNFLAQAAVVYLFWGVIKAMGLHFFSDPHLAEPLLSAFGRLGLYLSWAGLMALRMAQSGMRPEWVVGRWPVNARWPRLGLLVGVLVLFSLGAYLVSLTIESWVMPRTIESTLHATSVGALPSTLWVARLIDVVVLLAVVPIVEEFVFRGLLLQRWALRWGVRPALLGSSLLFGCLHRNAIGLTMFGMVMGLLYLKTRSLWVPVLCHGVNNALVVGLEMVVDATGGAELPSLGELRGNFGWGLLLVAVTLPLLLGFMRRNWPPVHMAVPYHRNR